MLPKTLSTDVNVYSVGKKLYIKNCPVGATITIYNLQGQKIREVLNSLSEIEVNLTDLANGNYVINVNSSNQVKTTKVSLVQ